MRDLENKILKLFVSKVLDKLNDIDVEYVDCFFFKCYYCGRCGYKIKDCFIKLN